MAKSRPALQPVNVGGVQYESILASVTAQPLGATGAIGDHLARIVITVFTSATSTVLLRDGTGGTDYELCSANTAIGVYTVELGIDATAAGGWLVTTGAGARVICIGSFT